MRIDFRDPNIPFSSPPSPTTSPDISPSNIPIFHGEGVKDLYLLLRAHQARQTRQNSGGGWLQRASQDSTKGGLQ